MTITTTIYDASNAITTGNYHTYKGERVEVEFSGTSAECLDMVDGLIYSDDENEVVHLVIVRPNARTATTVAEHSNPLFSAWNPPIKSTM